MPQSSPEQLCQGRAAALRTGFTRSLPIMLGYAPVGFAFGVIAAQAGMPPALAAAMSLIVFSGSGQFIAAALWFSGAGYLATCAAVLVTNLRYSLMAMALAPHVKELNGLQRFCFGWQITDELFAVHITAFKQGWQLNKTAIFSATFLAQASWTLGTLAGALAGGTVTDVKPLGLDFALAGMFLALLIPQCVGRLHLLAAVLAALFSVSLRACGLSSWNVILASIAAAAGCTWLRLKVQPADEEKEEARA